MELVKAALAEALRLLRLQAPSTSLQDPGTLGPPRDRYACGHSLLLLLDGASRAIRLMHCLPISPAAPPGLPPTCSPSLVSRGTQTEAEMEVEPSPGPPGLSNGPPAPPGAVKNLAGPSLKEGAAAAVARAPLAPQGSSGWLSPRSALTRKSPVVEAGRGGRIGEPQRQE